MKKIIPIIMCSILMLSVVCYTVSAACESGDIIGYTQCSDIIAYIDDLPIRSYNIDGNTFIPADDLSYYGFDVSWRTDEYISEKYNINGLGWLDINSRSGDVLHDKIITEYDSGSVPYLFTNVCTHINGQAVYGMSIDGGICINFDDLARFFAYEYVWLSDKREIRMSVHPDGQPKDSLMWNFEYRSPTYDNETEVTGEYAVWEFTKNEHGTFELTYTEGSTDFTPQISFGLNQVEYIVNNESSMSSGGNVTNIGKKHTIKAHEAILRGSLINSGGTSFPPLGRLHEDYYIPYTGDYMCYSLQRNKKYTEILENERAETNEIWKVYYNGERVNGISLSGIALQRNLERGMTRQYFIFDRSYPLNTVETVRIELR